MQSLDGFSFAGGDIEIAFLRQVGRNPYEGSAERDQQVAEVARRVAAFIAGAQSTLDIAIYDFRLHDEAAAIFSEALRERAKSGVVIRIAYDATTHPDSEATGIPAHVEADKKPPGTESFVSAFADIAEVEPISGYRTLMHNKFIVKDAATPDAAVLVASSNFTNDSWGLQENNLVFLKSRRLSRCYAADFDALWSRGKIVETSGYGMGGSDTVGGASIACLFTPGDEAAVLKEIVGAIAVARKRLYVASVVISSGPILAALSEAIDRGLPPAGLYDRPQMEQVVRQWTAAHVGADKINTWEKVAAKLIGKPSIPYDRERPHQPHNFMHNKLVVADDTVFTGSFNLSNHALGNAENVLLIREPSLAASYEQYIQGLISLYRAAEIR